MQNPYTAAQPRFTRLSKALSAALAAFCALTFALPLTREYLALVPGRSLPCVWNLVTSSFVTPNPIKAAAEILALLVLARSVEPVYGSTEFLRLVSILALAGGGATFLSSYVYYIASSARTGKVLYAQFCGFHGVVGGLLVALKQVMPDHEVRLFGGALRFRARYFPVLYVLAAGTLALALQAWTALPFLVYCTYASWLYLRFFQPQIDTGLRGDPSDEFAFATFFPDALRAPVDALAGACSTVTRLRHAPGGRAAAAERAGLLAGAKGSAGGGADNPDANRRRERGAKALEERLASAKRGLTAASAVDVEEGAAAGGSAGESAAANGAPAGAGRL